MESKSFAKVKGDKCFMFEADTPNKEAIAVVNIRILGCEEALTCLEDESSSTGARCVEFEEVVQEECPYVCTDDSDCCDDYFCKESEYGGSFCECVGKLEWENCTVDSECCAGCSCLVAGDSKYCIGILISDKKWLLV